MPIYEYECRFCNYRFQLLQNFNDDVPYVCPNCGKEGGVRKLVSPTMFELKGSGWYVTDYKNNNSAVNPKPQVKAKSSTKGSSANSQPKEDKSA